LTDGCNPNHNKGFNVLMGDGHVEHITKNGGFKYKTCGWWGAPGTYFYY